MSEFYDIDASRVSLREYWWGTKSPLVIIGWVIKWLHIPIPGSSDDPNTDSTLSFVVEALPPQVDELFHPLASELAALGFVEPVYHVIEDAGTRTQVYWATFRHTSGRHFARIHHRIWHQAQKANRGLFPMFFTEFADGTFLVSSAGKPDMTAPNTVEMNRMYKADTAKLWAAHEAKVELAAARKMISPVATRDELIAASERHHKLVCNFHLARGVFRPRSASSKAKAEAFAARVTEARAAGVEHAEVLAELERLQEQRPGWGPALWVVAGSLVLFIAGGAAVWDWKFTIWIIPVLLFHEGGHWLAMRIFQYRNLRMFFIPFFGAAVTGRNWNVAGWKKALVSLAGPLPGIALGMVLGILGLVMHKAWLVNAALALLFVNGLNLLPVFPLDGGHVLQDTLFCRNRWLDGAFRVMAVAGLLLLGFFGGAPLLKYVAIAMAISLPLAFKLGRVTDEMRRKPLPPLLPGEDRIPAVTAQAIINGLKAAFPAKVHLSNKMLAQHTVTIFERLNARPPGALVTICLLVLHGGAVLTTALVCLLLLVGKHGGLGGFFSAAARQPEHTFIPGEVQFWPAKPEEDVRSRTLVIATLKDAPTARAAFIALTNHVETPVSLTRLGDSLVASMPAGDDAAREHWYEQLQAKSTNLFVSLSNSPVAVSVTCLAPTAEVATNLTRELRNYLHNAGRMNLIPPWSPQARESGFAAYRQAREDWSRISTEVSGATVDPSLQAYTASISAAYKRGALAEVERLGRERNEKTRILETAARQRLRSDGTLLDLELLDLHAEVSSLDPTNALARQELFRKVAAKLGEGHAPPECPGRDVYGVTSGFATQQGLLLEMRWLGFTDVVRGLPALMNWLQQARCAGMRYELGAGWTADLDELGD